MNSAIAAVLVLSSGLRAHWRYLLSGGLANVILLVFYWVVIFPRTYKGVRWGDVPVLTSLSIAGGLVPGYMAWEISARLLRVFAPKEKK